jgi:hypothetical protein
LTPASRPARLGLVAQHEETREAEQLAFELGGDVAFLRATQGVYYARRVDGSPISPVLRLLRGLYELEPQCARFIARRRIFSTRPASAGCLGATRVAARRLQAAVPAVDHGLGALGRLPRIDAGSAAPLPRSAPPGLEAPLAGIVDRGPAVRDESGWLALTRDLAAELRRRAESVGPGERWDKPVAALLVDADGARLGWATNTGSRNATSHAEVNLVEGWLHAARRKLPRGGRVYVSLKPCKMCAGLLWDAAEDPFGLWVGYAEEDPLRYARETVLDAGSMARRRVARNGDELRQVLQRRLS